VSPVSNGGGEEMRERHRGDRELGAHPQDEQRSQQTPDAEADDGRGSAGEQADCEYRSEKERAVDGR
jgi:hypothetical protein